MGDFTKLDDLLTGFAGKTLPGCACVIRKGNEILHESYAGWADIEQKTAVDRESVFRQASTTKLFTYAIMGMLYEEGKFRSVNICRSGGTQSDGSAGKTERLSLCHWSIRSQSGMRQL